MDIIISAPSRYCCSFCDFGIVHIIFIYEARGILLQIWAELHGSVQGQPEERGHPDHTPQLCLRVQVHTGDLSVQVQASTRTLLYLLPKSTSNFQTLHLDLPEAGNNLSSPSKSATGEKQFFDLMCCFAMAIKLPFVGILGRNVKIETCA